VFYDQDVAGLEADGVEQFVGDRITGEDFVGEGDGDQAEFVR
jgi:hypothetical protein